MCSQQPRPAHHQFEYEHMWSCGTYPMHCIRASTTASHKHIARQTTEINVNTLERDSHQKLAQSLANTYVMEERCKLSRRAGRRFFMSVLVSTLDKCILLMQLFIYLKE